MGRAVRLQKKAQPVQGGEAAINGKKIFSPVPVAGSGHRKSS